MIHMHNTLMQFWVEAINIAYYTTNNIFLRHGIKKTHFINYGLEENLILNILEPLAVSVIYSEMRRNLENFDAKFDVGIFLGYSIMSKAYRVYNQNS